MARPNKETLDLICKRLADEGKLIEAGWQSLKLMVLSPHAPEVQFDEMRMAFFAGAQHTFSSMMGLLDEGDDYTENDLSRINSISNELEEFIKTFAQKYAVPSVPTPEQPKEQLGDQPVEEGVRTKMEAVATVLDRFFNNDDDVRKVGFVLLVFGFGAAGPSGCNFVSNGANRQDIVSLFKEMIERFSNEPDTAGHADDSIRAS